MCNSTIRAMLMATAFALAGCGGGGGGGVNSTPFVPAPTPTPTPTAVSPFYQPVSASESLEFNVVGGDIRIRWDNDSNTYEVMLPGSEWATISPDGSCGSCETTNFAIANSNKLIEFTEGDRYSYTGIADTITGSTFTSVAYGIATPSSGMPVTGSASYAAELWGGAGDYGFLGSRGQLNFDFTAGTLAGYFDVVAETPNSMNSYDLGRYDFVNTIYSTGSQGFSGSLSHEGSIGGSFSGLFTGPVAQELMGQWELPFADPVNAGSTLSASGVFIGKTTP